MVPVICRGVDADACRLRQRLLERGPAPVARLYRAWQQASGPLNEGKMLQYSATILLGRSMPLNQPAHEPVAGSSAGDGGVTGAAGVWALLASPPASRLPQSDVAQGLVPGTRPVGGSSAGDGYGTSAAGAWALLASSSDRRPQQAASRRIDVAQDLVPGTRLWEAACRR